MRLVTADEAVAGIRSGPSDLRPLRRGRPLPSDISSVALRPGAASSSINRPRLAGPLRLFTLLHDARPVLLDLGEPGSVDIAPWGDRVQLVDATHVGPWELPGLGPVDAPSAVLIRPDGYVAWVGAGTQSGLADALTYWFGPPAAA